MYQLDIRRYTFLAARNCKQQNISDAFPTKIAAVEYIEAAGREESPFVKEFQSATPFDWEQLALSADPVTDD